MVQMCHFCSLGNYLIFLTILTEYLTQWSFVDATLLLGSTETTARNCQSLVSETFLKENLKNLQDISPSEPREP